MTEVATGTIHHIELWVPDLTRAEASWGWLLGALGYELFQQWPEGQSWRAGGTYIVLEQSPARSAFRHDRLRPGLNHLAFHVATSDGMQDLVAHALDHGWRLMFIDRHPYAGGDQHFAAYLEDQDGYEVELVAPAPGVLSAVMTADNTLSAGQPDISAADSRRSRDDLPTSTVKVPRGQVQPPASQL
ncbi:MAG: hypothetical protein QOJ73_203 [Streptosporangiaceae bacterium]|jgi:catechol 2,3-dioxygenase-like lactoylglutathione lyase family enzyme|nr:hypothetical protein [Streptosporangiaceae bacterium]